MFFFFVCFHFLFFSSTFTRGSPISDDYFPRIHLLGEVLQLLDMCFIWVQVALRSGCFCFVSFLYVILFHCVRLNNQGIPPLQDVGAQEGIFLGNFCSCYRVISLGFMLHGGQFFFVLLFYLVPVKYLRLITPFHVVGSQGDMFWG